MKSKLIFLISGLFICSCLLAQSPIESEKVAMGYKFSQNGSLLNMNQIQSIVSQDAEAQKMLKKAKANMGFASVLSYAGGACIGWPIGGALAGGDFQWGLFAAGIGLVAVAIPVSISSSNQVNDAVQHYNSTLQTGMIYKLKPTLKLDAGDYGVGLVLRF